MAHCGSTLPSAGSLNNLDFLADSQLDLASWLLEDDLYQQDFGKGAKDMHSISSAVAGHASPPFITSQDLPDWMEASSDINWDKPLNLEECFNNDLKQQQLETSSNEFPTLFTRDLFVDPDPFQQQQPEYQKVLVQKNETEDVIHNLDGLLPPEKIEESSKSLHSSQDSFTVSEKEQFHKESPFIISVPLTEVFVEQKPPVFKTINITGIELINVAQKPVFCSTPIHSGTSPYLPSIERKEPQKIVINLRRVTLPAAKSSGPNVEIIPPVDPLPQDGPTLKEVLTRDDADDFIREMVTMPTISPAHLSEADTQEYSASHSSVNFEDSSFEGGYASPSDLLLYSPSSSGGLGSVHSQDAFDSNTNSSDDDVEDNPSQDAAVGAMRTSSGAGGGDSLRYAPYKSLEKKLRKKEQNKRAALRYRQKKKEEEETVFGILQREEEKQKKLNEKYNALQMEVKLMKKLMREMLVSKGAIK